MDVLKKIHFRFLAAGFVIGLVCVYLIQKKKREVVVYPTKDNADSIQYKDVAGTCFHPKPKKVACPSDKSLMGSIMPQM
jgi:hypothetical protein